MPSIKRDRPRVEGEKYMKRLDALERDDDSFDRFAREDICPVLTG